MDNSSIITATAIEVSGLKYFYSSSEDLCIGALRYVARTLGEDLTDEDALLLIPALREALAKVQKENLPIRG